MSEPWTYTGPTPTTGGTVTLIEGFSFCLSDQRGDLSPDSAQGLFFLDTRFLSELELHVCGIRPEPLSVAVANPFSGTFLARVVTDDGEGESDIVVFRLRYVGRGMREEVTIRNYGAEDRAVDVTLTLGSDFAGLFDVKEERHRPRSSHLQWVSDRLVRVRVDADAGPAASGVPERHADVAFSEAAVPAERGPEWRPVIPGRGAWSVCFEVTGHVNGEEVEPRFRCGQPVEATKPALRHSSWRAQVPMVESDPDRLGKVISRSVEDLGALRMFDPDEPDRTLIAAGAPWFMSVVRAGLDSRRVDGARWSTRAGPWAYCRPWPDFQGREVDPETEEEPGRILHEVRFGTDRRWPSSATATIYYGTVDATPLFVVLLGRALPLGPRPRRGRRPAPRTSTGRWSGSSASATATATVTSSTSAAHPEAWPTRAGRTPGTPSASPTAGCADDAHRALRGPGLRVRRLPGPSRLARGHGDEATARGYREQGAATSSEQFNRDFWLAEPRLVRHGPRSGQAAGGRLGLQHGPLPLERHREPTSTRRRWPTNSCPTTCSAAGGSAPSATRWPRVQPRQLPQRLGLAPRQRPRRRRPRPLRVPGPRPSGDRGLLDGRRPPRRSASGAVQRTLPGRAAVPAPYPTSCIPQAWAAAAPLLFLRIILGLDVDVPAGRVTLDPCLPAGMERIVTERLNIGPGRLNVRVDETGVDWQATEGLAPLVSGP